MKYLISALAFLLIISCKSETNKSVLIQNIGEAFGTTYNIQYESEEDYHDQLKKVFEIINQSMSTYLPDSDISKINRGDTTVIVDHYFREVFNTSEVVWKATNGYFDPTVGPLVNAFGFGPSGTLKGIDSTQIDSIRKFVGFQYLKLTDDLKVVKEDSRVYIDFNAIAKGYAIDVLGRVLERNNVENYLIELGGELLSKGVNAQTGNPWIVAIDDPTQLEERTLIKKIKLQDKAMASSGNYRKTRMDPLTGAKYVHTIDPKTGWPKKSNILSVSVLAENCMLADAYATAFMAMDLEQTEVFLMEHSNIDAYIIYVDTDGTLQELMTDGFNQLVVE
jgi:thiamine biosynthesis lipoprotein